MSTYRSENLWHMICFAVCRLEMIITTAESTWMFKTQRSLIVLQKLSFTLKIIRLVIYMINFEGQNHKPFKYRLRLEVTTCQQLVRFTSNFHSFLSKVGYYEKLKYILKNHSTGHVIKNKTEAKKAIILFSKLHISNKFFTYFHANRCP